MSAEPLRHFYVAPETPSPRAVCQRAGCSLPASDPVHLEPGDWREWNAAVNASTTGVESHQASPSTRNRARSRNRTG